MNRVFLYICFVLLSVAVSSAQSIAKLMESIKNYDYYHTKVYAHKVLSKRKKLSAGAYALAYIYYQPYQPFHNLDSADKYIHLAVLNGAGKVYVSKYGKIDSLAIYTLYDSIAYKQFSKIKNALYPGTYDIFLRRHPFISTSIKQEIKKHHYKKVIEYAMHVNKSDTTFYLITQYTENPDIKILHELLDKQIFNETTLHQTPAEYLLFLRNYPKNIYRETALQSLLDVYIKEKNTSGLINYAREFAKEKYYSEQAWKWLFVFSVKRFDNAELERFIQEYPDFPFKKDILEEMKMNTRILLPYQDTSEYVGFIDTSGHFVIPPMYEAVSNFKENIAVVFKNDTAYFINKRNEKIIPRGYKDAMPFYNGYAPVFDGTTWYFINRLGAKQSDDFEQINELSIDKNYVFKKNNLYGLCDYKGQIILPATFEKLGDFENHSAYYIENNLYGIIRDNGEKFEAKYQWISPFDEYTIAIVKLNNQYGIVDSRNENILNAEYDLIFRCFKNIYIVVKNKKYGYFDILKKCFIFYPEWDYSRNMDLKNITNGKYFKLILQNKVFIGDENGVILNKAQPYHDVLINPDFMFVKNKRNKWGIYKHKNIEFSYTDIEVCDNHTLIAEINDEYAILDKSEIPQYKTKNSLKWILKNYYYEALEDGGKIIDITGKEIMDGVENYTMVGGYGIIILKNGLVKVLY